MKKTIVSAVIMAAFCFSANVNAQTTVQKVTTLKAQCDKTKKDCKSAVDAATAATAQTKSCYKQAKKAVKADLKSAKSELKSTKKAAKANLKVAKKTAKANMKSAEKKRLPLVDSHIVLANYLKEGTTTRNHKASLKERFRIMAKYYGFFRTSFNHVWFALRTVIK